MLAPTVGLSIFALRSIRLLFCFKRFIIRVFYSCLSYSSHFRGTFLFTWSRKDISLPLVQVLFFKRLVTDSTTTIANYTCFGSFALKFGVPYFVTVSIPGRHITSGTAKKYQMTPSNEDYVEADDVPNHCWSERVQHNLSPRKIQYVSRLRVKY